MGIRALNKFLQAKCKSSIKSIPLSELSGKKIAVDISIYLYKYISENALLENLYLMISIFRENNITPIFIFDGKPPSEKNDTIASRKKNKTDAREEYYRLKLLIESMKAETDTENDADTDMDTDIDTDTDTNTDIKLKKERREKEKECEINDLSQTMEQLKKKFISIKYDDIQNVKTLLQAYGMTYFEAPGEADILCAKLVTNNIVYACLSEDTDMFVYGCGRVLRYLSLSLSNVVIYDLNHILKTLNISMDVFKKICILYGCDYTHDTLEENSILCEQPQENLHNMNIFHAFQLFKKYRDLAVGINLDDFYDWIISEKIHTSSYIDKVSKNIKLFEIDETKNLELYDHIKIMNGPVNKKLLIDVMKKENFIFIEK
jgi:flap endonuclease-1